MILTMKKVRMLKHKRGIFLFSFKAVIILFVAGFAVQYHKEIIAAVECILGIGYAYIAFVLNFN